MYNEKLLEARVSSLEDVLKNFMINTEKAIKSVTREVNRLSYEMREFKDEMREFKDEMREFKDEMREFKDEMSEFKDEMSEFKQEMRAYKDENSRLRQADTKEWNKKWGNLANKLGTIVEDIVSPAVRPVIQKYFNDEVLSFAIHVKRKDKQLKLHGEFDVVAVSEHAVYLIETKASPSREYLNDFKENIEKFIKLFPEYNNKKLIPLFASLRFDNEFVSLITEYNIYAMAYREWLYMDILNFEEVHHQISS